MSDLFVYGTLRHPPLLEVVLGHRAQQIAIHPAILRGYSVFGVRDNLYPAIVPDPAGCAPGLVLGGLEQTDLERLTFYEAGFDYALRPVQVELEDASDAPAVMFFPDPAGEHSGEPWSLHGWEERWAPLSLRAASEVMVWFGRKTPAEIARMFPGVRKRAAAWLAARQRTPDPQRDVSQDVQQVAHRAEYANFHALDEVDLRYRKHDGAFSEMINRCALIVGEAAVVLPYDPVRDCVLLIEQFRAPVWMAGDPAPWVWEPVAGLLDPGETPRQAALRETQEEAGLTPERLEPVGQVYSSTGSSTEFVHLFIGISHIDRVVTGAGLASEGEDIKSRVVGFDAFMDRVDQRQFVDMPLVTCALWLARHRDRLRR